MNAPRYFWDRFRRLLPVTGILTLIFLICHLLEIRMSSYDLPSYGYLVIKNVSPSISFLTYLASVYALFLPVALYSYRFRRESEDLFYALPVDRRKLALVHYLVGACSVSASFTLPYFLGIVFRLFSPHDALCFGNFFSYYPVALLLLLLVFSMGSLFSFLSRSTLENVLVLLLSQLFFLLFSLLVSEAFATDFLSFVPLTGISYVTGIFDTLIGHSYRGAPSYAMAPADGTVLDLGIVPGNYDVPTFVPGLVLLVVLSLLLIPVLLFSVPREKSEETGRPSRAWWGLRGFLPALYLVSMALFGASMGHQLALTEDARWTLSVLSVLLSSLAYLPLDMLRRRKISVSVESLVFLGVGLALFGLSVPVAQSTWNARLS